jgi:FkbM family methyltransferase
MVQAGLLALYRMVSATGLLNTPWGRSLFESAYWLYKGRYEAPSLALLRQCVRPGTLVVDVGAHIGFFTLQLASWVSAGGRVLALEPEEANVGRLKRATDRARVADVVEVVRVAVSDRTGEGRLEVDPLNPAAHKLGTVGVPVTVTTVDALLAERGWPEVSLIKIDVQGAEARVLAGAREAIDRFRPALVVEVHDRDLRFFGSSAAELLRTVSELGYTVHTFKGKAVSPPLALPTAVALVQTKGYVDFLCCSSVESHPSGPPSALERPSKTA